MKEADGELLSCAPRFAGGPATVPHERFLLGESAAIIRSNILHSIGRVFQSINDHDAALTFFLDSLTASPDNVASQFCLGQVYHALHRHAEAEAVFSKLAAQPLVGSASASAAAGTAAAVSATRSVGSSRTGAGAAPPPPTAPSDTTAAAVAALLAKPNPAVTTGGKSGPGVGPGVPSAPGVGGTSAGGSDGGAASSGSASGSASGGGRGSGQAKAGLGPKVQPPTLADVHEATGLVKQAVHDPRAAVSAFSAALETRAKTGVVRGQPHYYRAVSYLQLSKPEVREPFRALHHYYVQYFSLWCTRVRGFQLHLTHHHTRHHHHDDDNNNITADVA